VKKSVLPPSTQPPYSKPTHIKKETSTEDLRSVLSRIAKAPESMSQRTGGVKKDVKGGDPSKEKIELKQLIQSVMQKEVPKVEESSEPLSNAESIKASPTTPANTEESSIVMRQKVEVTKTGNTVTPKELERMMRITTSDKPPV
jgi:hypothetical protein